MRMTEEQIAASLDLSRHVNSETGELGDVIVSALIDELGPEAAEEAQSLGMAAVARVVQHFDGSALHVSSTKRTVDAIRKDRARSLFADGKSLRQVTGRTGLSDYHARKVRSELEETCNAGVLGASPAQA